MTLVTLPALLVFATFAAPAPLDELLFVPMITSHINPTSGIIEIVETISSQKKKVRK
jgi:hypothetical protein